MTKKYLKLGLLAASVAASAVGLSSCEFEGELIDSVKAEQIVIWGSEEERNVVARIIKDYNDQRSNDDYKFKYRFVTKEEKSSGDTLKSSATNADAPVLVLCVDDHIGNLIDNNIALEVTGSDAEFVINENQPKSVSAVTGLDGKIYGYPICNDNSYILWYNSEALNGEVINSFEDILKACQEQNKKFLMPITDGWYVSSFIMAPEACGLDSLKWERDSNDRTIHKYTTNWNTNPIGAEVCEYISDKIVEYKDLGVFSSGDDKALVNGFKDGSIIAGIGPTSIETSLKDAVSKGGGTLAATKLPQYHIGDKAYQMSSLCGSKAYVINKKRPQDEIETAKELVELLTNEKGQLERLNKRGITPSNKAALSNEQFTSLGTIAGKALTEQLPYTVIQSKATESKYWNMASKLGNALFSDEPKNDNDEIVSWSEYLNILIASLA